ncbi:MAG: hypothetical protein ACI8Z7_000607 [Candidatus Nanohaloarchaea archaeon]|jgi:hypothetical protein
MIAGLILTDNENEESFLAFLDDNQAETFSIKDTGKIVDKIVEKKPEVLAVNCGTELSGKELTKDEEELKEEGYSFTPSSNEKKKVERLRAIDRSLKHHMDKPSELIRFDPFISSEELALDGDRSIEALGIESSEINSSREFDAVVGAITAQFYKQNQYSESGVVIPESI